MTFLEKPLAFLWRDLLEESSYKFSFVIQLFGIFTSTLGLFFLSKLLGDVGVSYLEPYGGDYFSFVLIGIAFYSYLAVSMQSLSGSIREGQMLGTLEALLITQTEIPTIILSSSLYSFIWASFRVLVYLLLGIFAFGLNIEGANVPGALLVLALTIVSFSSLGIISASFIMVLKRGDPVSGIFTTLSSLFGGLYFPISVLPDWLQTISYLLPVTYALEAMRLSLLKGYALSELMPNILVLSIFAVTTLPLSIVIFAYAIKRAKRDGTLTQY